MTDKFGHVVKPGDKVVYLYRTTMRIGTVVKQSKGGYPVVDNWPSWQRNPETNRWGTVEVRKSLGKWKEFVKLEPETIIDISETVNTQLKQ